MRLIQSPDDPNCSEGPCDRCGTILYRYRGQGDISCPNCDANYNCFGQRLRDDLHTRINPSEYDDDIDDLTGDELSYRGRDY